MVADAIQSGLSVWQRQEVVEICGLVGRPSQMLGDQGRLVAFDERTKAFEMSSIERLGTADRHAHTVHRDRMITTYTFECMMR